MGRRTSVLIKPGNSATVHFLYFHLRSKSSSQPFATDILFETTKTMGSDDSRFVF
jgi:hypothetical protein